MYFSNGYLGTYMGNWFGNAAPVVERDRMAEASLFVQRAIRQRLINDAGVLALVPAESVLDRNSRPIAFPSIIIGEAEAYETGMDLRRSFVRVYSTLHIWTEEDSLIQVKEIAGAMRKAIRKERFLMLDDPDFASRETKITGMRFMRDPSGEIGHGVVTLDTLLQDNWVLTL